MSIKKVLMIAYYFPPVGGSGVIRTLKFAKYLIKYGWESEILTVKERCYESYIPRDFTLLNEIPVKLKVHRTLVIKPLDLIFAIRGKLRQLVNFKERITLKNCTGNCSNKSLIQKFKDAITSFLSTPDKQIGWIPFALIKGRNIIKKNMIDIIYSTAPPWTGHLIGYLLKKITKKPWVADFRDPWTQDILYEERSYTTLRRKIENFLEGKIIKSVDRIICISETMRNNLINKYPLVSKKIDVITNGFDIDDFRNDRLENKEIEKFTISYIGNLYHKRNPRHFLLAISQLPSEIKKNIKIQFIGKMGNDEKEEFRRLIIDLNLKDIVESIDYVPYKIALRYLKSSNVLLLIIGKQRGSEYILTGKIFEYIGSNKPILALVPEGEAANLIRETNVGIVVDPEDIEGIRTSIKDFFSQYLRGCLKVNPNREKINEFNRERLTERLVKIMDVLKVNSKQL